MKVKKFLMIITLIGLFLLPVLNVNANSVYQDIKGSCPTISLTGTHVSCYGGNNGYLKLTISGGSGNFTITWSNGATNVYELNNLIAGYYDVHVIDNVSGCTVFAVFNITQPELLTASATVEDVSCKNNSTGDVYLSVSGGTKPYSYLWSNGALTQNINSVTAGDYSVTVTDKNNCTVLETATIKEPAQALASEYTTTEILCNNESNGAIDLTVWGGTPPYTYDWNGNTYNSQDLNNLPAGNYNVVIKDKNNCSDYQTVKLSNPAALQMTSSYTDNICFGENNGEISLTIYGGTGDYNYTWSNSSYLLGMNSSTINNLPNEEYHVIVNDENNCQISSDFSITSPTEIVAEITSQDVTLFGGSDGMIDLTVSGGVPYYYIEWSNGVYTEDNNYVPAGLYEVLITDQNNCTVHSSALIEGPLEPLTFSYTSENVSCYAGSDAEIFVYPSGGTKPYKYSWSTGDTLSYITHITAGKYIITLTDANGINLVDSIIISQPDPFNFSAELIQPSCYGISNGAVNLTVTGGTSPYEFEWYDADYALAGLTKDLTDIPKGEYTVKVIDTLGCSAHYSVYIDQPTKLQASIQKDDVLCNGDATGSIYAEVSGGIAPYSYLWSNNATTQSVSFMTAGTYNVTVTDQNGCQVTLEPFVSQPKAISIELYPTEVSCMNNYDGYIQSVVTGGSGDFTYLWSNSETTSDIFELVKGEYSLTVTDIFGCSTTATTFVDKNETACLTIPTTFSPNGDNINDVWNIENIFLYPECQMTIFSNWGRIVFESTGYELSWDGTQNGKPLPAGTYYYILNISPDIAPLKGTVTIIK